MTFADDRYDSLFRYYGERHGVDWRLLKAQARAESGFDPDAVSPVGAKGLSQFMDRTWAEWRDGTPGIQEAPPEKSLRADDPEDAIRAQAAFMAWLQRILRGDVVRMLAAYNWGIGRVWGLPAGPVDRDALPAETHAYIVRIDRYYREYGGGAIA